jgi:hypothetical protein
MDVVGLPREGVLATAVELEMILLGLGLNPGSPVVRIGLLMEIQCRLRRQSRESIQLVSHLDNPNHS